MQLVILLAVFGAVFCVCLALSPTLWATLRTTTPAPEPLLGYPLLDEWVRALAARHRRAAPSEWSIKLEQRLVYAGHPLGLRNSADFIGLAELIGIVTFIGMLLVMLLLLGLSLWSIAIAAILAGLALWLTYAWLDGRISERRVRIARQYPYFLDLAVMTMESGASFLETLEIYIRDNPKGPLTDEFRSVLSSVQLGRTWGEALRELRGRLASDEVRQSVNALIQGQRMGTPLGLVLRQQADGIRFRRTQQAERMAEELKVKINGPVVLMMLAVFILILGPAVINVINSGIF